MKINKIKFLAKEILDEGLNKNEYNKLLEGLNLGIELEVINEEFNMHYTEDDSDMHADMNFKYELKPIVPYIIDLNGELETLREILDSDYKEYWIKKEDIYNMGIELTEVDLPKESYSGYVDNIEEEILGRIDTLTEEINVLKDEIGNKIEYIEGHIKEFFNADEDTLQDINQFLFGSTGRALEYIDTILRRINDVRGAIRDGIDGFVDAYHEENNISSYSLDIVASSVYDMKIVSKINDASVVEDYVLEVTSDASLSQGGVEIVTPPMKYNDFIMLIPEFTGELSGGGYTSDDSCGYHIGMSHDSIDIIKQIKNVYNQYLDKGYSGFASLMIATQQGFMSTEYHNPTRDTRGYAKSVIQYFEEQFETTDDALKNELRFKSLPDDILLYGGKYSDYFKELASNYFSSKYVSVNTKHKENYVELRTLGDSRDSRFFRMNLN